MKESAFYNTSWQVQYFPLFMNAGAGKKGEMSEGFFLRNEYLKPYFVFSPLIPKLLMQKSRATGGRKTL